MYEWAIEIDDSELIVRGICSPYHVKKGKLRAAAFDPSPNTEDVSVMRVDWIGTDKCREHARLLENPDKTYRGLAVLSAQKIRESGVDVVDSRDLFRGHADIKMGIIVCKGEPPSAADKVILEQRKKALLQCAAYYEDPDPSAESWLGPELSVP